MPNAGAHAELAKGASRGSTGRALLQDAGGRAAQDLYANINQLVTALCQYESGASCDVDLNGTSSWCVLECVQLVRVCTHCINGTGNTALHPAPTV